MTKLAVEIDNLLPIEMSGSPRYVHHLQEGPALSLNAVLLQVVMLVLTRYWCFTWQFNKNTLWLLTISQESVLHELKWIPALDVDVQLAPRRGIIVESTRRREDELYLARMGLEQSKTNVADASLKLRKVPKVQISIVSWLMVREMP